MINARWLIVAVLALTLLAVVHADVSPSNKRVAIDANALVNATHLRDYGSLQLNGSLTGTATFDSTLKEVLTNGITGYIRIPGNGVFAVRNGSTENDNGTFVWWAKGVDDATNDFMLKTGAGTPSASDYCQWASSNNWRTDTWNASGGNEFYSSGLACSPGVWQMFAKTIDGAGLTRTYTCTLNGSVTSGNTFTPTGGRYRTPSTDAVLFGDSSNSVNGSLGGFRLYNKTLGVTELQGLCEQGKNFELDNLSMSVGIVGSLGTTLWRETPDVHTGFLISNISAQNPTWEARVDLNNDGSEDTLITQAAFLIMKAATENISSTGGCYGIEASLESVLDASGNYKNVRSNYANVGHQKDMVAKAAAEGRCVSIEMNYMPGLYANTTDGYCTGGNNSCFPKNFATWTTVVYNHFINIGCDNYTQSDGTSVCEMVPWNEVDVESSAYLGNNVTSGRGTNTAFLTKTYQLYNASYAAADMLTLEVKKHTPSFADVRSTTSRQVRRSFMGNYSGSQLILDVDLYKGAWSNSERTSEVINLSIAELQADCATYNFNCSTMRFGEYGTYNASNQNSTVDSYGWKSNQVEVAEFLHYFVNNRHIRFNTNFFELGCINNYTGGGSNLCATDGGTPGRFMSVLQHPQVNSQLYLSPYDPLFRFTSYHDYGSNLYSCNTGDYFVLCTLSSYNGAYYITLTNRGDADRNVNLTFANGTVYNLTNKRSGTVFTASSNRATLTDLSAKASNTYQLGVPEEAVTVNVTASTINSTTNNSLSDLALYCTGSSTTNRNLTYNYQIYKNSVLNFSSSTTYIDCTQEGITANGCSASVGTRSVYTCQSNASGNFGYMSQNNKSACIEESIPIPVRAILNQTQFKITYGASILGTASTTYWNFSSACLADFSANNRVLYRGVSFSDTVRGSSVGECWNSTAWETVATTVYRDDATSACSTGLTCTIGAGLGAEATAYDGDHSTGVLYSSVSSTWRTLGYTLGSNFYRGQAGAIFDMGIVWRYNPNSNETAYIANVSRSGLVKAQQYVLSCQANDGLTLSTYYNSSTFTVGNVAPNATSVFVAAIAGGVNCTYSFNDYDSDTDSGSTYRWFRNGTLISPTARTLGSSNYTSVDTLVCEVRPNDGTDFGSYANSSTYTVNDVTAPVITSLSFSQETVAGTIWTVAAFCTDDFSLATGYPVVSWKNPSGVWEGNYTMTSIGGGEYERQHVFSTVGTYTDLTVFCRDGNANEDVETSAFPILVTSQAPAIGGGGGGGTIIQAGPLSGAEIVKPLSKSYSDLCTANSTIEPFEVQVYNPLKTDTTYLIDFREVSCDEIKPFSVSANAVKSIMVAGCMCPGEGESVKGEMIIVDGRDKTKIAVTFPIVLSESLVGLLLQGRVLLAIAITGIVLIVGFVLAAKR